MHARLRGPNNINSSPNYKSNLDFPCLAGEIAKPRPDMNIKCYRLYREQTVFYYINKLQNLQHRSTV